MPKKDLPTKDSFLETLKENYPDNLKLEGGFNAQLDKTIEHLDIKVIKKALELTDKDIAKMFGYKDANGFRNSTRRPHIENGIVSLYKKMSISPKLEIENSHNKDSPFYVESLLLSIELLKLDLLNGAKVVISDDGIQLDIMCISDGKDKSDQILIRETFNKFKGLSKC